MEITLTQERLKEVLSYDKETGEFQWKTSKWNLRGRKAGCRRHDGYLMVRVDGVLYYGHRLAWLYVTGVWPLQLIDHRDTDRSNNRWLNLRDVSQMANAQNVRKPAKAHTKSGLLGVQQNHKGWQACIAKAGERYCLGTFKTPEEAHAVYVKKKREIHEGCTL